MHLLRGLHGLRFGFLNDRIHHIRLPSQIHLLAQEAVYLFDARLVRLLGDDGLAPRRQLVDHAHVQIAVNRQRQRARNGRRGHHQHVRMLALFHQLLPLLHAEAMLFVHDREPQFLELHVLFKQRVRADHHWRQSRRHQRFLSPTFSRAVFEPVNKIVT